MIIFIDDGGSVVASGDLVKIAEVVTSGSQSTITFPSIPATFRHLELQFHGAGSNASATVELRCRFNGDSGNNYDIGQWSTTGHSGLRAISYMWIGDMAGSTAPANMGLSTSVWIPDYRGTTFDKSLISITGDKTGTSSDANIIGQQSFAGFWRSTSAINSILLYPTGGNFIDGSTAVLYGKM